MAVSREERNRILGMVKSGQVSATEAAQLLDALQEDIPVPPAPSLPQNRTVRVWVTDMVSRSRKVNMTATLPVPLLKSGLQTLASIVPPLRDGRAEEIIRSLENGTSGRVVDLQDLEDGRRVEIFLDK